jgi:hypothetical protein
MERIGLLSKAKTSFSFFFERGTESAKMMGSKTKKTGNLE